MSDDPTTWDLNGAVIDGNAHGLQAMVEAVRRYGARDLELGYRWSDHLPDPGPDATVTWYATATFRRRGGRGTEQVTCEAVGTPGQHQRAQMEALAALIRTRGGVVELVER